MPAALVTLSAIPLTAGTLRRIQLAGGPVVIPADLAKGAGWVINLAIAEWVLRRPARRRPARRRPALPTGPQHARALS